MECLTMVLWIITFMLITYTAISQFFLRYPRLLHKPKVVRHTPVFISHRGGSYCKAAPASNRAIARLADVFATFPHMLMNVDVKADNDELISRVAQLVRRFQRQDRIIWGSFYRDASVKMHEALPEVPQFFPFSDVLRIMTAYVLGYLPFISLSYDYLELPLRTSFNFPDAVNVKGWKAVLLRALFWYCDRLLLSRPLYDHLKARGIPVIFWVCNTDQDYEAAFRAGAQGVMTDYPSRLRTYLHKNKRLQSQQENHDKRGYERTTSSMRRMQQLSTESAHSRYTELRMIGD